MSAAARPPEGGVFSRGEMGAQRPEGRAMSAAARPPEGGVLRVAVLIDTPRVNRYLRNLLDWLSTTDGVVFAGLYRAQRGYPPKPDPDDIDGSGWAAAKAARSSRRRGWTGKPTARLFFAVDQWCSDLPGAADPRRGMQRVRPQPLPESGIDCDLLIRAGADDASAWTASRQARHGAIGLDFAIDVDPRKSAVGLDEVARREHETGFVLYRIVGPGPRAGEVGPAGLGRQTRVSPWPANVIRHGWYPTRPSAARNRAQLYGNVLQVLKDAVLQCAAAPDDAERAGGMTAPWASDPQAVHDAGRPVAAMLNPRRHGTPSLARQCYFAYRAIRRTVSSWLPGQGRPVGGLGVLCDGHPVTMSLAGVQPVPLARRPLRDEACLVVPAGSRDARAILFLRERSTPRASGAIVALQLDLAMPGGAARKDAAVTVPSVTVRELGPVLTAESFASASGWTSPFVFDWEGVRYLCASTAGRGRIVVHRAVDWPTRWEPAAVLMEGVAAAGTVLFAQDGRWWMLTNLDRSAAGDGADGVPATGDTASELHAFHADHPLATEWTPHPLNPLRIDSRGARNAGLHVDEDGVHRCGQLHRFDGEGCGVALYRIATLTPEAYREVLVRVIDPEHLTALPGLSGVQGFLRDAGWAVIGLTHRGRLQRSEVRLRAPARRGHIVLDSAR